MKTSMKYMKLLFHLFLIAVLAFFVCYVLPRMIVFFLPLVIGWMIAVLANPLVKILEKKVRIVRRHSSMLIIITAILLVIGVIYFVIAKLGGQLIGFIYSIPELYEQIARQVAQIEENFNGIFETFPYGIRMMLQSISQEMDQYMGQIVSSIGKPTVTAAGNFAKNIPSYLLSVIFTILFAYFFIAEREQIMSFFRTHTPKPIYDKFIIVIQSFKQAVGGYFKAQFKIMGVVFLILFAGFLLLGVRYSILFAIVISLLDFLPFLGTGTVLLPWAIFQFLSQEYTYALGLIAIYIISQTVRQLIQPKIVGDTVGLSPIATLLYIYIGYKLSGVMGMILAVPAGVIIQKLYQIGAFSGILNGMKEIAEDMNKFRKM